MFERAIECLESVGTVVHRGNEKQCRSVGKKAEARRHGQLADEFDEAIEILKRAGDKRPKLERGG